MSVSWISRNPVVDASYVPLRIACSIFMFLFACFLKEGIETSPSCLSRRTLTVFVSAPHTPNSLAPRIASILGAVLASFLSISVGSLHSAPAELPHTLFTLSFSSSMLLSIPPRSSLSLLLGFLDRPPFSSFTGLTKPGIRQTKEIGPLPFSPYLLLLRLR